MELRVVRERLTLALIVLLPFHAFFVTVATRVVAGPGHAPLGVLALWKEGLLALIVLIAAFEVLLKRLRHRFWVEFDAIDGLIVLLVIIASLIGLRFDAFLSQRFLYGFRYDLLLPLCFMVLRRVAWSPAFKTLAVRLLVVTGVIVAAMGVVMLLLPISILQGIGYSDLHSLYQSGGPLAPFQMIGETGLRRMQSVMSGPNQLGLWLLLPYAATLVTVFSGPVGTMQELWSAVRARPWYAAAFVLIDCAIGLTFSRAAWLAAVLAALIVLARSCTRAFFVRVAACFGGAVLIGGVAMLLLAPQILLRATSNAHHLERPLQAIGLIRQHPLGLGLGTAGPATNRLSDTCVQLPEGADASWANVHPHLCVTVGDRQVQPLDRPCTCPVLPENWYLQMGVELGALGAAFFVLLVLVLLYRVRQAEHALLANTVLPALAGVALAGLVLHSFEDFGVSATLWVLLAVLL